MVKNQDSTEKRNSDRKDVDLLGQEGSNSEQFSHRDFSERSLKTTARVRQAITNRGGQLQ